MGNYFGTDGIRGPFGGDLINIEFGYRMGSALGKYLSRHSSSRSLSVLIGRDTPSSGLCLTNVLTLGLSRQGVRVSDLGIAHDGDGDRLVVCDEQGNLLEGDVLLGLFAVHALRAGALNKNTFVTTIQSNLGLDKAVKSTGGQVERTGIGDRNVAHRMREIGVNMGGESSGNIIFTDFSTTGDGLLAAVKLIEFMLRAGQPLSKLRDEIQLFPQATASLQVAEKKPLESLDALNAAVATIKKVLGAEGRVLARYSGTECKLRLLVEGKDQSLVTSFLNDLKKAAAADLNLIEN